MTDEPKQYELCSCCGKPKKNHAPATPLAAAWAGHRYGLQALKPALEPIIVFQKPYQGRPVDSITRTGAGALWVDGGRVGLEGAEQHTTPAKSGLGRNGIYGKSTIDEVPTNEELPRYNLQGRWPANFALTHAPDCNGTCAPGCPVAALDAQSGHLHGAGRKRDGGQAEQDGAGGLFGVGNHAGNGARHGDTGTASRFFHRAAWALDHADPVLYQAKASRKERDAGLGEMPLRKKEQERGTLASTGYNPQTGERTAHNETMARNPHPTIKPIALAQWLATLLLPPAEYGPRRLLIPFAGVASEMIGAGLAGWECIVGVEGEAEYVQIARARLAHWLAESVQPALFQVGER